MAQLAIRTNETAHRAGDAPARQSTPQDRAFTILHLGYTALPILAGLDKFTEILVDWDRYLAPIVAGLLGPVAPWFMRVAGVVEIAAGVVVFAWPRFGGWLVAAWLAGIIANLLAIPGYFDVAVRDFGLALGAIALAELAAGRKAVNK